MSTTGRRKPRARANPGNDHVQLRWRARFLRRREVIAALIRRAWRSISKALADILLGDDGGIILSKVISDRMVRPRQIMLYRSLVKKVLRAC